MPEVNKFTHRDLIVPSPIWASPLVDCIIELEKLRDKKIQPASWDIFIELKSIFHSLENWASARIEGNQTQLVDALAPPSTKTSQRPMDQHELQNLRNTINFIDEYCRNHKKINNSFIREVHKRVVTGLPSGEGEPGDATPGRYRTGPISIGRSKHLPPHGSKVIEYMDELIEFINSENDDKDDILKAAIAHHRLTWIHPFNNGNGRVTRLITYSMLQMMGYGVAKGTRLLNPSAIFNADRQLYYDMLAAADSGETDGLLQWCEYFATGLREEIEKTDRLLDVAYIRDKILSPVIESAFSDDRISDREHRILIHSLQKANLTFASRDINDALGSTMSSVWRSRQIKRMKELDLIQEAFEKQQRYVIQLLSPLLYRYVIEVLESEGFVRSST